MPELDDNLEPLCPECKEENMEYVDAADLFDSVKDVWRCNYCGHVMPV